MNFDNLDLSEHPQGRYKVLFQKLIRLNRFVLICNRLFQVKPKLYQNLVLVQDFFLSKKLLNSKIPLQDKNDREKTIRSNRHFLYLKNNCQEGYINYYSQAYVITGYSPTMPIYTTNGINLTNPNTYVQWNSGFSISNDFTLKAWVQSPTDNSLLIKLSEDSNNYINISYLQDPMDVNKRIVMLEVYINNSSTYIAYSNSFTPPTNSQQLCIQVRRINSIYEVLAEVM